jgi:tetrahydromethanopterin S-methyltransferase subunit B
VDGCPTPLLQRHGRIITIIAFLFTAVVTAIILVQHRKEIAMSDLDKIKEQLSKLESGASNAAAHAKALLVGESGAGSFLSRKLLVAIAALVVIIILGPSMGEMMKCVEKIVIVYIIVQGVVDVSKNLSNAWVRGKMAEAFAADGKITEEESETLKA